LVKARQEAGCSGAGLRHKKRRALPLKRLFRGVTEAFAAFLRLGGVMISLGGVRLFLGGFSVRVVGQKFRVGLWVTKRFWQQLGGVSFNGGPLLWSWVRLFLYGFRGFGSGCTHPAFDGSVILFQDVY
jgi:hypothetical protein